MPHSHGGRVIDVIGSDGRFRKSVTRERANELVRRADAVWIIDDVRLVDTSVAAGDSDEVKFEKATACFAWELPGLRGGGKAFRREVREAGGKK